MTRYKTRVWFAFIILMIISIPARSQTNTTTFISPDYLYSFEYPNNWEQIDTSPNFDIVLQGTDITFGIGTFIEADILLNIPVISASEWVNHYSHAYAHFSDEAVTQVALNGSVFEAASTTFDAYSQYIFAVDYGDKIIVIVANLKSTIERDQLLSIIDGIQLLTPSLQDIEFPLDLNFVNDVTLLDGEYEGITRLSNCPDGKNQFQSTHILITGAAIDDGDLLIGGLSRLRYESQEIGVYGDGRLTWEIISESQFVLTSERTSGCTVVERYYRHIDPEETNDTSIIPTNGNYQWTISRVECDNAEVRLRDMNIDFVRNAKGLGIRLTPTSNGMVVEQPYVYFSYFQPTEHPNIYQQKSPTNITTITILSDMAYERHTVNLGSGCKSYHRYTLIDPPTFDESSIVGLNASENFTENRLVGFGQGQIALSYPDIFSYENVSDDQQQLTLDNGDIEIIIYAQDHLTNRLSKDISPLSLNDIATQYFDDSPQSELQTLKVAEFDAVKVEQSEGNHYYFLNLQNTGIAMINLRADATLMLNAQELMTSIVATINTPAVLDVIQFLDYEITLSDGQVITPENGSYSFFINSLVNQPQLRIFSDSGYSVDMRFDTGLQNGSYTLTGSNPRLTNDTPIGLINLPSSANPTEYSAIYGTNSQGTMAIELSDGYMAVSFDFISEFSQFVTTSQPEMPDEMPAMLGANGFISGLDLNSLED